MSFVYYIDSCISYIIYKNIYIISNFKIALASPVTTMISWAPSSGACHFLEVCCEKRGNPINHMMG